MTDDVINGDHDGLNTRMVNWDQWLAEGRDLCGWRRGGPGNRLGVILTPDLPIDHPQLPSLTAADVIVIEIASFTDGRVFSLARLLRQKLGFRGRLRPGGDYLPDQVSFLERVGFDWFPKDGRIGQRRNYYSGYYQPDTSAPHRSIRAARTRRS